MLRRIRWKERLKKSNLYIIHFFMIIHDSYRFKLIRKMNHWSFGVYYILLNTEFNTDR